MGVNCSAPEDAVHLLTVLDRRRVTLPLVVYPNSGELWVNGRSAGGGGGQVMLGMGVTFTGSWIIQTVEELT